MLPSAGAALLHRPVQRWRGNPVDTALLFHDGEFPLWVYYNFVIKISRKKHTQPPSSPSFGEGRASVEREKSIWDWAARTVREKYMSGRGRKKKEEGEQIKSCQMEILGFKRSETGVRVCLFSSRLYVMQIEINIYAPPTICPPFAFCSTNWFLNSWGKRPRRRAFPRRPSTPRGKKTLKIRPLVRLYTIRKTEELRQILNDDPRPNARFFEPRSTAVAE